jgi:DNA-binding MarR family transcriptional regulator
MEQPTLTINRLRQELDEKCERILDLMVLRGAYQVGDAIRFNELFRMTKEIFKRNISKPTYSEHLGHLIKKKLIIRKHVGKQETRLYLNLQNPKIAKLRETKAEVDKDVETFQAKVKEHDWVNVPTLLSWTTTIFELRRIKTILEYFLTPEEADENILAVAYQSKRQETLEMLILLGAANTIEEIKDPADKETAKNKMVEALDQAITKMQTALSNLMKKK